MHLIQNAVIEHYRVEEQSEKGMKQIRGYVEPIQQLLDPEFYRCLCAVANEMLQVPNTFQVLRAAIKLSNLSFVNRTPFGFVGLLDIVKVTDANGGSIGPHHRRVFVGKSLNISYLLNQLSSEIVRSLTLTVNYTYLASGPLLINMTKLPVSLGYKGLDTIKWFRLKGKMKKNSERWLESQFNRKNVKNHSTYYNQRENRDTSEKEMTV